MLTKYILHFEEFDYELRDDDLRNWDDIKVSYKRSDFDGVTRSFTSEFEFVGNAREQLLSLYLASGINSKADISVITESNRWEPETRYRFPLDFSTVSFDAFSFKINSVDSSLAGKIKSGKNTKFEYDTKKSIMVHDGTMVFDRIVFYEGVEYVLTGGNNLDDGDISMPIYEGDTKPYMGRIVEEQHYGVISNEDQTNDSSGFMFVAKKNLSVTCFIDVSITNMAWQYISFRPFIIREGNKSYPSPRENGSPFYDLELKGGDKVGIEYYHKADFIWKVDFVGRVSARFNWYTKGQSCDIPVFRPETVLRAILGSLTDTDGKDFRIHFSDYDKRLADTYIMAAEDIRGLASARLYSSFDDFSGWMSAVFGYTYYLGNDDKSIFFIHRNELFRADATVKTLKNVREVDYNVDSSQIYSDINLGYDKQDYNEPNGRYEFNFDVIYKNRCDCSDKSLSLKSKYRADGYGIEFLVRDKEATTTDTDSDQSVFFMLCKESGGKLIPDRETVKVSDKILGVGTFDQTLNLVSEYVPTEIAESLVNAAFNPLACLMANFAYIRVQRQKGITYSSSSGARIAFSTKLLKFWGGLYVIGMPILQELADELPKAFATVGVVEVSTDDVDDIADVNEIVEFSDQGMIYRGYIKEVDINYAMEECVTYKLIVKEIMYDN